MMINKDLGIFSVAFGQYAVLCQADGLPLLHEEYRQHARLVEEFGVEEPEGKLCFVATQNDSDWPFLVIIQRYTPAGFGFNPGVILIAETNVFLVGAGKRLLAYDLTKPQRLWEDTADCGFWRWSRHGDRIVMSAETELAAWDLRGRKSWSTPVEPPWSYSVEKGNVLLDVMGNKSSFPLKTGPPPKNAAVP